MKLPVDGTFFLYDFVAGLWRWEDVDTTMRVVPGQVLLVRGVNVTHCVGLDNMISLHAPARKSGKGAVSSSIKRKPDRERDPSNHVVQAARKAQDQPRRSHARSPSISSPPSSPCPMASSLLALSRQPCSSSKYVDLTSSPPSSPAPSRPSSPELIKPDPGTNIDLDVDTADSLWDRGRVLVPSGFGSWPAGIYARDMAYAFGVISSGRKQNSSVDSRFRNVFPGVPYVKQMYCRQLQYWRESSQSERDIAAEMPHNREGLWTLWREQSSGLVAFKNRKKG
ncbi:hypothetical protein C8J57DRAFT_1599264 [Mycena rebaudengoi]|nr:hypothetical protein C8J57DRAFT_1599264 [Mycena rebaudengoi]